MKEFDAGFTGPSESEGGRSVPIRSADAGFVAGVHHLRPDAPCQDHALAEAGSLPFAIVSDGCSSSGRTDLGSRLLTLSARSVLRSGFPGRGKDFLPLVLGRVQEAAAGFGLDEGDLDATLGIVGSASDGSILGTIFGDGVLAARGPWGLDVWTVDWAGNLPGYPSYLLRAARRDAFLEESAACSRREGRACCLVRRIQADPSGGVVESDVSELSAEEGLAGISIRWPAETDVAAAFSDGVEQIQGVHLLAAASELTAIRASRKGAFAVRRAARALSSWASAGFVPQDDLSFGVVASTAENEAG